MAALMLGIDFGKNEIQISLWNEEKTCAEMYPTENLITEGDEPEYISSLLENIRKRYAGASVSKIGITGVRMNEERRLKLTKIFGRLGFQQDQLFFSCHGDAVLWYEYCTGQTEGASVTMDFDSYGMQSYLVKRGQESGTVWLETTDYSTIVEAGLENIRDAEEKQSSLAKISELVLLGKEVNRLYVTGTFVDEPGINKVLGSLYSEDRRVFGGRGLYCLGACYHAVKESLPKNVIGDRRIFHSVYMNAYKDSEEGDVVLLKAGTNLETACVRLYVIPDDTMDFSFRIEDVRTGKELSCIVRPEGFYCPERKTLRLELEVYFLDYETMVIKLRDVGFGDINPASFRVWEQIVSLV